MYSKPHLIILPPCKVSKSTYEILVNLIIITQVLLWNWDTWTIFLICFFSSKQDRDAQKIRWIDQFVEELRKDKWVIPALKQIKEICCLFGEVRSLQISIGKYLKEDFILISCNQCWFSCLALVAFHFSFKGQYLCTAQGKSPI